MFAAIRHLVERTDPVDQTSVRDAGVPDDATGTCRQTGGNFLFLFLLISCLNCRSFLLHQLTVTTFRGVFLHNSGVKNKSWFISTCCVSVNVSVVALWVVLT